MVDFSAKKNIAMYTLQVQEKLEEAKALADEQATFATLELKKAYVERTIQLNSQAGNLVMDYNMKALITECEQKKYAFAQKYQTEENKLAQDYNKLAQDYNK